MTGSDRIREWSCLTLEGNLADHLLSSVVYNFGPVCMYVCQTITFERAEVGSSFSHIRYISMEWVKFVYVGRRVNIKVTGAKKVENSYSRSVKF